MKLIKLIAIACVMFLPMALHAEGMPWLTFKMADDTSISVASADLVINYSSGELQLNSPTVSRIIPVAQLKSMTFSSSTTGIESVSIQEGGSMEFYDMSGVKTGNFDSLDMARENLPSGIYVVKSGEKSIKVIF